MGPVRLFTPYKRRRRTHQDSNQIKSNSEDKRPKIKKITTLDSDVDNIHQTSNSQSKEAWQFIADGLDTNTNHHILENPESNLDPNTGNFFLNLIVFVIYRLQTLYLNKIKSI